MSPLLCPLSAPVYISQACSGQLYQAVHLLESMKPWSSGTRTSLATLGKVCTACLYFFLWERISEMSGVVLIFTIFTTIYNQALLPSQFEAEFSFKENTVFYTILFFFLCVIFILRSFSSPLPDMEGLVSFCCLFLSILTFVHTDMIWYDAHGELSVKHALTPVLMFSLWIDWLRNKALLTCWRVRIIMFLHQNPIIKKKTFIPLHVSLYMYLKNKSCMCF